MKNLNINQLLKDTLEAIQPIAKQREINLIFTNTDKSFFTNLPMDEVLAPVLWLVLRLLYIIPKGYSLAITLMQRHDAETRTYFLRLEMKTLSLPFNPNLIFRPDNNRFQIQHTHKQSLIFIEWALDADDESNNKVNDTDNAFGIDISTKNNLTPMAAKTQNDTMFERFEAFGSSLFIQEKLKATKSRKESDFLETVINTIVKNLANTHFTSETLEKQVGISKAQLFRNLKELTGFSTANYIRHIRLQKAAELLETTEWSISEIADKVGFHELSYFSSSFLESFHISPTEWRKTKKVKQ